MRHALLPLSCLLFPLFSLLFSPAPARAQESIAHYQHNQQIASWTAWWEANREPYLQRAVTARPNYRPDDRDPRDPAALATATAALRAALKSELPDIRAQAVVALARLDRDALPDLLPLTTDPALRVRRRAWFSLGLIDAEKELLASENLSDPELESIAAGLAVVDRLDALGFERLRRWIDAPPSWQVQRMAIWALRSQYAARQQAAADPAYRPAPDEYTPDPATDRALIFKVLRTTTNEVVADEAIATLGILGQNDPRSTAALAAILAGNPQSLSLPVFKSLLADARRAANQSLHADTSNAGYTMGLRATAALALGDLLAPAPQPLAPSRPPANPAPNNQYNTANNNNSAESLLTTCAFRHPGELEDYAGGRYVTWAYPAAAAIAAARIGRGDVPAHVLDLTASAMWGPTVARARDLYDPQRALSALALGIFYQSPTAQDAQLTSQTARPNAPDAFAFGRGSQNRASPPPQAVFRGGGRLAPGANIPFPDDATPAATAVAAMGDVLLNHARQNTETQGLRAACALAAGLAGEPSRADALLDIARLTNPRTQPLLTGELTLALSLLNDPRALDLASATLLPPQRSLDPDQLLKRTTNDAALSLDPDPTPVNAAAIPALLGPRAALTALATLQNPRAAPLLLANWGQNTFLSLESARAMRWCHIYSAVPALSALATQSQKPHLAALAIRSLGEILDRDPLNPRLLRMIQPDSYPIAVARSEPPPIPAAATIQNLPRPTLDPDLHALAQPLLYTAAGTWWDILLY